MAGNPDFAARGAEYIKTHPDLNERLAAGHTHGLTMDDAATWRILELARPDVADWLARDENHEGACWLMNLKGQAAIDEVDRIAARLDAQGFAQDPPIDAYLKARREAKTA